MGYWRGISRARERSQSTREEARIIRAKTVFALGGVLCACFFAISAFADSNKVVIGDIDDMSGPYADVIGPKGVEAIKMAIADFGGIGAGQADRNPDLRPSEQAGPRRAEIPRMGRHATA